MINKEIGSIYYNVKSNFFWLIIDVLNSEKEHRYFGRCSRIKPTHRIEIDTELSKKYSTKDSFIIDKRYIFDNLLTCSFDEISIGYSNIYNIEFDSDGDLIGGCFNKVKIEDDFRMVGKITSDIVTAFLSKEKVWEEEQRNEYADFDITGESK